MFAITLSMPETGRLNLVHHTPPRLAKYRIGGSRVLAARGAFGELMLQQINTKRGIAILFAFVCDRDTVLLFDIPSRWMKFHLALKGDFHWELPGHQTVILMEDHCNLYFAMNLQAKGTFKPGKTYLAFDIFYAQNDGEPPGACLQNYLDQFPFLATFHDSIQQHYPRPLLRTPMSVTDEMRKTLVFLLFSHDHTQQHILFSNLLENLMLTFLLQAERRLQHYSQPSMTDIEKVYLAEHLIVRDLAHPPDMADISRKISMGESKLRKAFVRMFTLPPKAYWQHRRMQQAAEWLNSTRKTVSEVGEALGFETATAFIQAFSKQYGKTPGRWRMNRHNLILLFYLDLLSDANIFLSNANMLSS